MSKLPNKIRDELANLERKLYDARTPDAERADLSLQVGILRTQYARLLKVTLWTATAALEMAGVEDEA